MRPTSRSVAGATACALATLLAGGWCASSWWVSTGAMAVRRAPRTLGPSEVRATIPWDPASSMIRIEPGSFQMGTPPGDEERDGDETWHEVTIPHAFQLARTEVSQSLYEAVVAEQPRAGAFLGVELRGDDLPVVGVTWLEAVRFCNALSDLEGLSPAYALDGADVRWVEGTQGYRLPTEGEWEYTARAGTWRRYGAVDSPGELCSAGNVADRLARPWLFDAMTAPCEDGHAGPAPVGAMPANPWGLHDQLGNVWEWTWDRYGGLASDPVTDPRGDDEGDERIIRGGSWWDEPFCLRTAARESLSPEARRKDLGFRLARSLP
jgi:formylglycine-generating enzyme